MTELERARAALERLAAAGTDGQREADARELLGAIARASRGELAVAPAEWSRFLDETTEQVRAARPALHAYLAGFETWLNREFVEDDWRVACERRSEIESLRAAYLDRLGEDPERWMDPYNLDEMLRTAGQSEGYLPAERIPPGTPATHWWWWLPAIPPDP